MELRDLKGTDIFPMLRLIKKLDIMSEVKELAVGDTKRALEVRRLKKGIEEAGDDKEKVANLNIELQSLTSGADIIADFAELIIFNADNAKDDLIKFMASLTETSVEEIEDLTIKEFSGVIKDFFTHKDFKELLESLDLGKSEN